MNQSAVTYIPGAGPPYSPIGEPGLTVRCPITGLVAELACLVKELGEIIHAW